MNTYLRTEVNRQRIHYQTNTQTHTHTHTHMSRYTRTCTNTHTHTQTDRHTDTASFCSQVKLTRVDMVKRNAHRSNSEDKMLQYFGLRQPLITTHVLSVDTGREDMPAADGIYNYRHWKASKVGCRCSLSLSLSRSTIPSIDVAVLTSQSSAEQSFIRIIHQNFSLLLNKHL